MSEQWTIKLSEHYHQLYIGFQRTFQGFLVSDGEVQALSWAGVPLPSGTKL